MNFVTQANDLGTVAVFLAEVLLAVILVAIGFKILSKANWFSLKDTGQRVVRSRQPVARLENLPESPNQPRSGELRAMDDRSLELIVAQHLGWHWSVSQPGLPPMLVPSDAPPGSMGHVAPSYVSDGSAWWTLVREAAERDVIVKLIAAMARDQQIDGMAQVGEVIVAGPVPRALVEAWVLDKEKTQPAPPSGPLWKPEMSFEAVGGRTVIEVPDSE